MHKPAGGDLDAHLAGALEQAPWLERYVAPVKAALAEGDLEAARAAMPELRDAVGRADLSPPTRKSAERGLNDVDDGLSGDAYWRAPVWKRVAVILAGPATNLVFAVLLLAVVFMLGVPDKVEPVVDKVDPGTPAAQILEPGDRIVAVNGRPVTGLQISERIRGSNGKPITLTVIRDGARTTVQATAVQKEGAYRLGFTLTLLYKKYGPVAAIGLAGGRTWEVTKAIGSSLGRLVTGSGREDVASPVGIVQASSQTLEVDYREYLGVLALISLSLALLNLLPFLPLDGGHIAFSIIEGIRGRAISREAYERASAVGIVLVLFLFFIGLSNDVDRLRGG
jgi:regulator of sigma E protease